MPKDHGLSEDSFGDLSYYRGGKGSDSVYKGMGLDTGSGSGDLSGDGVAGAWGQPKGSEQKQTKTGKR